MCLPFCSFFYVVTCCFSRYDDRYGGGGGGRDDYYDRARGDRYGDDHYDRGAYGGGRGASGGSNTRYGYDNYNNNNTSVTIDPVRMVRDGQHPAAASKCRSIDGHGFLPKLIPRRPQAAANLDDGSMKEETSLVAKECTPALVAMDRNNATNQWIPPSPAEPHAVHSSRSSSSVEVSQRAVRCSLLAARLIPP